MNKYYLPKISIEFHDLHVRTTIGTMGTSVQMLMLIHWNNFKKQMFSIHFILCRVVKLDEISIVVFCFFLFRDMCLKMMWFKRNTNVANYCIIVISITS